MKKSSSDINSSLISKKEIDQKSENGIVK